MNKINWILQSNLIREETLEEIKISLKEDNISYEEVKIIPFSDEIPNIKNKEGINIFYGTTTLILNAYKYKEFSKGIFYDKENFNIKTYIEKWGLKMLNHDSEILTFSEIIKQKFRKNQNWFLRPIEDDKSFSGRIMSFNEIVEIEKELANSNNPYLTKETRIAISIPKVIEKEWRHFIVNKKIISTCRYAKDGQIDISKNDIPIGLLDFVNQSCEIYTPHNIFVMDTALINGQNYIVECNCFNDTGFYNHDIKEIIKAINLYLKITE